MAFLVLLESLAPAERAVFLLRDVFGYDYKEIADIDGQDRSRLPGLSPGPAATSTRAGRGSRRPAPRARNSPACSWPRPGGDMTSLLERLAPDVVFYGDSGGQGETTFIAPASVATRWPR